jgi:hypothetical protein
MAGVVTGFAVAVVLSAGILLSRAGRRLVIDMTHRLR